MKKKKVFWVENRGKTVCRRQWGGSHGLHVLGMKRFQRDCDNQRHGSFFVVVPSCPCWYSLSAIWRWCSSAHHFLRFLQFSERPFLTIKWSSWDWRGGFWMRSCHSVGEPVVGFDASGCHTFVSWCHTFLCFHHPDRISSPIKTDKRSMQQGDSVLYLWVILTQKQAGFEQQQDN